MYVDEMTLQVMFRTYEEIFKFTEIHPGEQITIRQDERFLYFKTESGMKYILGTYQ